MNLRGQIWEIDYTGKAGSWRAGGSESFEDIQAYEQEVGLAVRH
jgi:hypothetical protein